MSKKNFNPVIVALIVTGPVPASYQMQLKAPQIFSGGGVGRSTQECSQLANGTDVAVLRVLGKLAHAHVVEHAGGAVACLGEWWSPWWAPVDERGGLPRSPTSQSRSLNAPPPAWPERLPRERFSPLLGLPLEAIQAMVGHPGAYSDLARSGATQKRRWALLPMSLLSAIRTISRPRKRPARDGPFVAWLGEARAPRCQNSATAGRDCGGTDGSPRSFKMGERRRPQKVWKRYTCGVHLLRVP